MKARSLLLIIVGFLSGIVTATAAHAAFQQRGAVADALVASPDHYKLEFENEFVRVIRGRYGPHETGAMHSHPVPGGVVVNLTEQHLRQILPDGTTRDLLNKAGVTRWSPAATHQDENLDGRAFEVIRVDLKQTCR